MAIAFVQSRATSGGPVDEQVLAYTSNVTAGNLLLLAIRDGAGSGTANNPAISDTLGNTYTRVARSGVNASTATLFLFWAISGSSGANTVTANADGTSSLRMAIYEFSGSWATPTPFGTVATNTGSFSPEVTGNVSPSGGALLFSLLGCVSDITFSAVTNSFTLGVVASSRLGTAYRVVTSGGTYNTSWSWTGTDDGTGTQLATFLEQPAPTITVQPANDVGIISNGQSTVYTATATGTTISALTWKEDGASLADGGIYDIVTTGIGTGSVTSTLTITRTDKTGTPFDIKANVVDANGNTDTNTVTDTWWTGPTLTTFPATDGSGDTVTTLTCDYLTGVGEFIAIDIPVSDGTVSFAIASTNVTAVTSTLTSSAASFTAGGAGVTLTFTARDASSALVAGYTPVPESGVV